MRDVFGVISIFIQNIPIVQEDIEYDKKMKILLLTPERQDVRIAAHSCRDGKKSHSEVDILTTKIWFTCVVQVQ